MDNVWLGILLVAFAVAWIAFTRLGKISGSRAGELVASGAILVDVRTEAEFTSGHLVEATNVPLNALSRNSRTLVDAKKPIVVYCASGMRSAVARGILRAAGAKQVFDLGAMSRW
jgi:rhodanese-related sulfurtransferase